MPPAFCFDAHISQALRALASRLLRPPRSPADNAAAQRLIISLPPTPAGFVPPRSAPPLPSTFAFAPPTPSTLVLPARRPPPDPSPYAHSMPATHASAARLIPTIHALDSRCPHACSCTRFTGFRRAF
ncbi:hypothetical protein B0H14DRAFT_3427211 [Mycena olivaceomarginata]|nr:hypothetical protein B0H14DRAFT_3427211 [Mycena olivaceomarginata]